MDIIIDDIKKTSKKTSESLNDLISIILPTYNDITYLKLSIKAILNQTYKNFELIIVDDGSTDGTGEYIKKITDKRIIYIYQKNKKLPSALNAGHAIAKGKYITWTSSDNIAKPNWIYTLYKYIINNDFVYSLYSFIDKDGDNCGHNYKKTKEEYIINLPSCAKNYINKVNCIGASFMYSNILYKKIGEYNEKKVGIEDYDMWYRMLKECEPIFVSESLYYYRIHKNSMTIKEKENIKLRLSEFHKTKV